MDYQFITTLSERQYNNFIKGKTFTSYKQEATWSKTAVTNEIIYVGVTEKKKIVAAAKIEVRKKKKDVYFEVPGGYILDYDDKELLLFFTKNLHLLAKSKRAYEIKLDFISSQEQPLIANMKETGYRSNGKNDLLSQISLKANGKFLSVKHFKNVLGTLHIEKDGLFFDTVTSKAELSKLYETAFNWSHKIHYNLENLLSIYKGKIAIIVEKLDLIFYLNYLRESYAKENDIVTIEELIEECGDYYILGFAIMIFPNNKENAYCLEMKHNGSFPHLDVSNQLLLETIKLGLADKYKGIIYPHQLTNEDDSYTNYKYKLVTKKWKYIFHKVMK